MYSSLAYVLALNSAKNLGKRFFCCRPLSLVHSSSVVYLKVRIPPSSHSQTFATFRGGDDVMNKCYRSISTLPHLADQCATSWPPLAKKKQSYSSQHNFATNTGGDGGGKSDDDKEEFVLVTERLDDSAVRMELPIDKAEKTLRLHTLNRAFPGTHGLKYKNSGTGTLRALLSDPTGTKFMPPAGGWAGKTFAVIYAPKISESKAPQKKKPVTVPLLSAMKQKGEKFAAVVAYDATMAGLVEEAGMDVVLVGDSLGMTVQGHPTTLPVTVDHICYHLEAVARSLRTPLVIADYPFRALTSLETAIDAGTRFLATGHAQMIKLEGSQPHVLEIIRELTSRQIPTCAHLGLTPQAIHALGGYRVQGKTDETADRLVRESLAVQEAGAVMLLVECVPNDLGGRIAKELRIPVFGIGGGAKVDGQLVVIYDLLGMTAKPPKFAKDFVKETASNGLALKAYVDAVKKGTFPGPEQCY